MADSQDVVIVDPTGTEHHFPAGFDPVRAGTIVRQSLAPKGPPGGTETGDYGTAFRHSLAETGKGIARSALDALPGVGAIVGGAISTPESLGVGTIPGVALGAGIGRGARDLIGHATGLDAPTTPLQKAGNIAKDTAIAGATQAVLPGLVEAGKAPVQTLREAGEQFGSAMPPWVRRLGNLIPSVPKGAPAPILTRPPWQSIATDAAPITSSATPVPARLQAAYNAIKAQTNPGTAEAWLARQPPSEGLSGTVIPAPPASSLRPIASHAPSLSPVETPNVASAALPSPLRDPRVAIGAEATGRQAGMTKQAVRNATGPVLGEDPGAASPILPRAPSAKIIGQLKDMGPQGANPVTEAARDAYVMRANNEKARAQIKAYLDALRAVGFSGAAGLAARKALTAPMQGPSE